jgi:serine/threonine protein kinase
VEEDLAKHIKKKRLSALQVKSYGLQILKGLEYLHKSRVMHRDLKPQNILVTREGVIKLADFGLAREFLLPIPTMSKEIETLWYRSPELLLGCARYDQSIDLWTVGCVIY